MDLWESPTSVYFYGVKFIGPEGLEEHPVIVLTYPVESVFGVPPGTYTPNVTDGYWMMLAPLAVGAHTLHFKSEITGGVFAGAVIDVTYGLTVGP